ncbi:expressed unknown protein [Seminavis robusta]|uniref:PPIase cyclophilin-type domain-containing protein n=1 Tax=Seminavis robusta TaxID=568900 RepID=A0A9N8EG25_9STRA|nr:expressed unknown protein [Seminavis robusta]|eukprot:Sro892_g216910.1 n/a (512) ;mRNA; f:9385-11020
MIARKRFFDGNASSSSLLLGESSSCCDFTAASSPSSSMSSSPSPSPPSSGRVSPHQPTHRTQSTPAALRQRIAASLSTASSCASTPAQSPIKRVALSYPDMAMDGMGDYTLPLTNSNTSSSTSNATHSMNTNSNSNSNGKVASSSSSSTMDKNNHGYNHHHHQDHYLNDYHHHHQSPPQDDFYYHHAHHAHHHHQSSPTSFYILQAIFVVAFVALASFGVYMQESNVALEHALRARDHEIDHHLNHLAELEIQMTKISNERTVLQNHLVELEQRPTDQREGLEAQRRLFHLEHSHSIIQQGIQRQDIRMVQEKFGKGPLYYVEMKLSFPLESNVHDDLHHTGSTLFLETAPLSDMPHAIHLFLEQVDHGLYDGTHFFRHAPHVLQAGPSGGHSRFRKQPSLASVLFQEYSPNYPHTTWTVGYPGRPGGPDFYINTQDNSRVHGPGGQQGDDEPEPCFAKVVAGHDVVTKRLQLAATLSARNDNLQHPIRIASMRVISQQEYLERRPIDVED